MSRWFFCDVCQVTELECVSGQTAGIKTQKTELNQTIEELEAELKAKEEVRRSLKHTSADLHTNLEVLSPFLPHRNWRS